MACPIRTYPLRKPENHRQPVPRWTLSLPDEIKSVYTAYIGVQRHSTGSEAEHASQEAISAIQTWLELEHSPVAVESFVDIALEDRESEDVAIWVCYWSDDLEYLEGMKDLGLSSIHSALPAPGRVSVGLWAEHFSAKVSRLETNYSGLDYLPGLAKLPGASTREHNLSAYWGAARDRIPDSAHDPFPEPGNVMHPDPVPRGFGQHLIGVNHANMVHIRSGQWWENCGQQEADAYEQKLEPTLRSGLQYLREGENTGAVGIRYLRNADVSMRSDGRERKESCGAGFFMNLEDLERWAHKHPSHLKIYRGALSHYKEFGDRRRFRTWHEVQIIRAGFAQFEYVNCGPKTGATGLLDLKVRENQEDRPTL